MCVKFTFANKIETMHERSLVSVKFKPHSISRLHSALFTLPLFYLRDSNSRVVTCGDKNASVEIKLNSLAIGSEIMRHVYDPGS